MAEPAQASKQLKKNYWVVLFFSLVYPGVALACLRQWRAANPWSHVDFFSGGYLAVSLLWIAADTRWHKVIFRSAETLKEASGASYDPWLLRWITVFAVAELTVFLDYGHWCLVPALVQPALQATGVALCFLGGLWLVWTDSYLARHFASDPAVRKLINEGPYHYIRHPRYAAVLVSRIALALSLASVLGWVLALSWLLLILRRIRLEEAHLRELFAADYDAYAARTACLLPCIY